MNVSIDVEIVTSGIRGNVGEHVGETDLLKQSSSEETSSAVSGGMVDDSSSKIVRSRLVGISRIYKSTPSHGGEDNLGDNLGACSDYKSVLFGVLLELVRQVNLLLEC